MINRAVAVVVCMGCCASIGRAQEFLRHPEQFYSNGDSIDGWTRNDAASLRSTFWFVKYPADGLAYRQQIVIVYDRQPDKAYYYDATTKRFVGRFDLEREEYSLLPQRHRRSRLEDIDESMFPPGGEMPQIGEMFEGVERDSPGHDQMMMTPPPTMEFPNLEKSSWDTTYLAANGEKVRSTIQFDGHRGAYTLKNSESTGSLSHVEYERREDEFRISGIWRFEGSSGWFSFSVPMDNMDALWGDWGYRRGRVDGTWNGVRRPR